MADDGPIRPAWPDYPRTGWGLYFDPLYGYIPLPPLIRQALDLATFQRLRRIKQLSTIELAFPGATHNRFEHSVGVYHLATTAYDALVNRWESEEPPDWPELHETHKIALQLASLFHDIGHGPHAHVFELYCHRNPDFRKWHHEIITHKLIVDGKGKYTDIPSFLTRLYERFRRENVPGCDFLKPENISAIALGQPPPADRRYLFLSQLIHSECDVDRMDYLRRDALHVGFAAGGIDVWEIIHNFTIVRDPDTESYNLRLLSSAAEAFESLLAVRDMMYRRVYYNPAHRSAQEMMVRALHDISEKIDRDDLCLLTDEEMFERLTSDNCGTAFSKEVVESIRARRLYHSIPARTTVYGALDAEGQRNWSEYATGLPGTLDKLLNIEKKLSKQIDLPPKFRIIFDIAPIPVTKPEAYTTRYFYDPDAKQVTSLKELLPHLELTHGKFSIDHTTVDLYERYRREVSRLYIFVPFEYLQSCVEAIHAGVPEEAGNLFRKTVKRKDYLTAREATVPTLRAIGEAFANDVFGVHSPDRERLVGAITKSALTYLDLIFSQRYPEISLVD